MATAAKAQDATARTCRLCGSYRPLTDFPKCRSEPGGRSPVCRCCRDALNRDGAPPRGSAARLDRTRWMLPPGATVATATVLAFCDPQGRVRMALGLDRDGNGVIRMFDERGAEV